MQDTPNLPSTPTAARRTPPALAAALFLVPPLLALLGVLAYQRLSPVAVQRSADLGSVTNRPPVEADATQTQLQMLRRDLRNDGYPVEDVNLRLWAARASEPERLFNVPPPEEGKRWNWHVSQDGRCAVAVSVQPDAASRRAVGLYDLVEEKWVWRQALPWPDAHEPPFVFDRHTVLRYTKNATRFAMEIAPDGRILDIASLGKGAFAPPPALPADPAFPGAPVAARNGVFFAADEQQHLIGYALERLPGLRYAGKGDDNTLFSGNGQLKFSVGAGRVTVCDSLTQTVLQRIDAWPHRTNTVVTGALATHDGSQLSVFLRTDFSGTPPASREWSVSLSLYNGTAVQSFNADALLAKPRRALLRQALSPDGNWLVSASPSNELTFAWQPDPRPPARLNLGALLGLRKPLDHLAFLEEGRHLVLRQADNFWLLDFDVARGYADLLARKAANAENPDAPRTPAGQAATPDADASSPDADADASAGSVTDLPISYLEEANPSIPSALALRAQAFAANQAWAYAAALLEEAHTLQQRDARAPQVNLLLLTRCHLLAGQRQKARATSREGLNLLLTDRSDYNRMIRYHLQGLYFAKP